MYSLGLALGVILLQNDHKASRELLKSAAQKYHLDIVGSTTRIVQASSIAAKFKDKGWDTGCELRLEIAHVVLQCIAVMPNCRIGVDAVVKDLAGSVPSKCEDVTVR